MTINISYWNSLSEQARAALLQRPAMGDGTDIRSDVEAILAAVRGNGDHALRELTKNLDNADLQEFRVSDNELAQATAELDQNAIAAIDLAITNVHRFHKQQLPQAISVETMPGVTCERLSHALESVGLYVPAGTAPLPSAAIMLAVPAAIASCPIRIMCTPPRPDGSADPAVLVAASRAGTKEIFKVGGAQAIAAMAYGTETIPRVRKIFGPGNTWVTTAKTLVSVDPAGAAIDMPAGPSEVLVIADDQASAEFVAADLLSQAEHGVDSQVLLLTTSDELAEQVSVQVESQIQGLSRADIARQSLQNSQLVVVESIDVAVEISNQYAPEHLILQTANPREVLATIRNAGSVFVGPWSPEAVGDYCSGTNHVLPTYGFAAAYSGLGVDQFMRHTTVQELTREGLAGIGDAVITLAGLEGLDAHASAVEKRLGAVR